MSALTFRDVRKRYPGGNQALDGLTFEIPKGTIAGFVGPNGAGKTTAFSVVSGFLPPDGGEIDILGTGGFEAQTLKGRLGVLPQDAALPEQHTPRELIVHLGRLQGLSGAEARAEADRVLTAVSLDDRARSRIASLSHGMRRRVAVASALCGDPELVLLDEPLAGLDPVQAHALRDTLAALGGERTLVVSSHNLAELERICDWVVMLVEGRCVRQGTLQEVTGRGQVVRWGLGAAAPLEALEAALPGHRFELDGDTLLQHVPPEGDPDTASVVVMRVLSEARVPVRSVARGVALEQRFIDEARRSPATPRAVPR